jgi:hypothetical protein
MERPPIPRPAPLPSSAPSRVDPAVADNGLGLTRDDLRYLMQQYADAPRSRREAALHYAYATALVLPRVGRCHPAEAPAGGRPGQARLRRTRETPNVALRLAGPRGTCGVPPGGVAPRPHRPRTARS